MISARMLLGNRNRASASNVGQQVEIFVVFVFAAFSFAKHLFRLDELDTLDPFDHLVAKLVLDSQPQGRSIYLRKPLPVHLRGQQTLRFQQILQALRVVIGAAVESFAKGEKGDDFRFRFWPHQFDERLHGNAAPLRDAAPSLDAMMHGDVFGLAQLLQIGKRKLDRPFDEASHLEPEILEAGFRQALPIVPDRHFPIGPEVRRDFLLGILLLRSQAIQRKKLHRIGHGLERMLQSARMVP